MDYPAYRSAWSWRSERQRQRDAEAASRALVVAGQLAQVLVEHYGATRVILVGSLARGDFGARSDIDLAVAGVSPDVFFRAGAELERSAGKFSVDLVPLESANAFLLEAASREGLRLA